MFVFRDYQNIHLTFVVVVGWCFFSLHVSVRLELKKGLCWICSSFVKNGFETHLISHSFLFFAFFLLLLTSARQLGRIHDGSEV